MNRDEIDAQKIIVDQFEESISKSIKEIVPLGNNSFIILTDQEYPNNLFLAEFYEGENKPTLLKGKKGPALVIKDLVNIEAHQDIVLGGVEQNNWGK